MRRAIPLISIMFLGAGAMVLVTPYDYRLLVYLSDRSVEWFVTLMSSSVFELEKPGAGDIVVLFATLCPVLYLFSSLLDAECASRPLLCRLQGLPAAKSGLGDWLRRHRLRLEFLVVSIFCSSTLLVKTLQWIMARPRPRQIFRGTRPFYEWYEMGPYVLGEHSYRGSFPSPNTASAITLIGLAYILIYTFSERRRRLSGFLALLAVLGFTAAMAVARVMSVAQWPTDVVFGWFAGWLIIHLLFCYGFRLPEAYGSRQSGGACPPPPFRGFMICWYLTLCSFGLVCLVLGVKHFLHGRWPWLILAGGGVVLSCFGLLRLGEQGLFRRYP